MNTLQKLDLSQSSSYGCFICRLFKNYALNSIRVELTLPSELVSIANELHPTHSEGLDKISPKITRGSIETIRVSAPLAAVINCSFTSGIIPNNLKLAKVIPVFKSGKQHIEIYRPISILPNFFKILRKSDVLTNNLFRSYECHFV